MAFRFRLETVPLMREAIWKLGSLVEDLTVRLNKTTGLATPLWQRNFAGAYLYTNTVGDVVLLADGTVGAPAYSYLSSPTDGMYLVAANNLGFATNGVLRVGIENTNLDVDVPVYALDGAAATPSYTFDTETTLGIYRAAPTLMGFASGGVQVAYIGPGQIELVDGAVGAPSYSFITDLDMGMYRVAADHIGFSTNGVLRLGIENTNLDVDVPIYAIDGAVGAPSYSFDSDPDSGWYSFGANILGVATNGVVRQTIATTFIQDTIPHYFVDGVVGAPGIAWAGDALTGFYRIGISDFGVAIGGALDFSFTANTFNVLAGSNITMADDAWIGNGGAAGRFVFDSTPAPDVIRLVDGVLHLPNGAVGAPAWAATSETNTGAYFTASTLNWAIDGVQEMILTGTGLQVDAIGVGVAPNATTIGKFYRNDASTTEMVHIEQAGAGDATQRFSCGGVDWCLGIDNSEAGNFFELAPAATLVGADYYFAFDTNVHLGFGGPPVDEYKFYQFYRATDVNNYFGTYLDFYNNCTINGGFNAGCIYVLSSKEGVGDNAGTLRGARFQVYNRGAGDLTTMNANELYYGHSAAGTGTTINARGIYIFQFRGGGIMTNGYDVYIDTPTGVGTVTNDWCIYSLHDAPSRLINDLRIASDTYGLKLGAADDSGITYDGTNMVFDSRLVGTGDYLFTNGYIRPDKVWHAYGGFEDQGETITCGVGDWNHITNAGNNLWNLDENDGVTIAADVLTLTNTGDYFGTLSISLSGLNAKDFHVRVYNNTQARVEGRPMGVSTTGANNEVNVCIPIYIEGTAGDAIQFEIMSADGTDPDVDDGMFEIIYLHE